MAMLYKHFVLFWYRFTVLYHWFYSELTKKLWKTLKEAKFFSIIYFSIASEHAYTLWLFNFLYLFNIDFFVQRKYSRYSLVKFSIWNSMSLFINANIGLHILFIKGQPIIFSLQYRNTVCLIWTHCNHITYL